MMGKDECSISHQLRRAMKVAAMNSLPLHLRTFAKGVLTCWLLFATVPLWIDKVGLYQYLGIEILIFAIYALAFNLVLGHAGLPHSGTEHSSVSALTPSASRSSISSDLRLCLATAALSAGLAGALVALFISHRRVYYALMTVA